MEGSSLAKNQLGEERKLAVVVGGLLWAAQS